MDGEIFGEWRVRQETPTPEQFLKFVQKAAVLRDKQHGQRRVTRGTLKLLEQLGLERLEQLRNAGYGEAIAILRTMDVEIV